ncbi:ABC transporter ATP-binding protein [Cryptosporangium sp. NPDC048952]|uniref:ABC transporter ATP-binding protein n=1 Tax=Cryptosporangium sp. NPDC048952 TaxID=3363961 RepID=UPI0037139972
MSALLHVTDLHAYYDDVEVLHGVSLNVDTAESVVVLGANGAGKTTLLRSICRMVRTTGEIDLDGDPITGRRTDQLVAHGLAMVPQGRGTFPDLTVEDNLRAGGLTRRRGIDADIDHWYEVFPRLRLRRDQAAGSLSGGEQQMLAIARAMMSHPRLLLLDEPSLGLAPNVVEQLFGVLTRASAESGVALLIVEQNAQIALADAQRAYVLEAGTVAAAGTAAELTADDSIRKAYLGY